MIRHSADINLFNNTNNSINDIYDFLINNRCTQSKKYKSKYCAGANNFELYIEHIEWNENWYLECENLKLLGLGMNLDIERDDPKMNICLDSDRKFISNMIEQRLIDCVYYPLGLIKNKKCFFSSNYEQPEIIGYEYAVFIKIFLWKYIKNNNLNEDMKKNMRSIMKKSQSHLNRNKIIKIKENEIEDFYLNIKSKFTNEIKSLINLP